MPSPVASPANVAPPTEPDRPAPSPPPPPLTRAHCDSMSSDSSLTTKSDLSTTTSAPRQLSLRSTPPPGRLLAVTHASAAIGTPASFRRKPISSPRPLSSSRLPRRDTSAPIPTAPVSKWSARIAQRVADAEKSNQYARNSASATSSDRYSGSAEKPLPSRPVASFTSAASPSKDGRTLLDASERPLHRSIGGDTQEWPALTPRSVSAPEHQSHSAATDAKLTPISVPRKVSSNNALGRLTTSTNRRDFGNSRASGVSHRSSNRSFVSAEESVGSGAHSASASVIDVTPNQNAEEDLTSPTLFTTPGHSLAAPSDFGDPTTPVSEPVSEASALPNATPQSQRSIGEMRRYAASPANFSRLHGALAYNRLSSSTAEFLATHANARQQNTASRIPIPDRERARLVRVGARNPSRDTNSPAENSPAFGARRLASPQALSMLDEGSKRRLGQYETYDSFARDISLAVPHAVLDLRTSGRSRSSSPGATTGVSTDDDDEVATPISQPRLPRSGSMTKLTPGDPDTDEYEPISPSPLDIPRLRRNPPSKSRHTRPLQTIPSQAVLTADLETGQQRTSSSSTAIKRVSQVKNNQFRNTRKTELKELLTAVKDEDEARLKDGVPGLDNEAKGHLTRTLSLLEGQGTPPSDVVDYDKLFEMFGHLTFRPSNVPRTNTFIDNAAAAAMFLERGSVSSEQLNAREMVQNCASLGQVRRGKQPERPVEEAGPTPRVTSKWSDSTPSAFGESTELLPTQPQHSIGHPSTLQAPSITAETFSTDAQGHRSTFASRNSSPTLGSDKQKSMGSVRRARENIAERGGFSRMTAASASKKTSRTPTSASKAVRKPDSAVRGRDSNTTNARVKSPHTTSVVESRRDRTARPQGTSPTQNEARSRSKSRTVLAKINGFFSHKREKKSQQIPAPPLPTSGLEKTTGKTTLDVQIDNSEPFRTSPTPPLPPVPAALQQQSEQPRSSSPASNASLSSAYEGADSVITLAQKLITKAKQQSSPKRKERMLSFASILQDAVLNAKEAQLCAEKARQAALQAETACKMTVKAMDMLASLASGLVQGTVHR